MGTLHVSRVTPRVLQARQKRVPIRLPQLMQALQIVFRYDPQDLREIPQLYWMEQLNMLNGGLPLTSPRYDGKFLEAVRRLQNFPMGH